jgi:hypothetical protein
MQAINLVGQTFGRLEVVERAKNDPRDQARFVCKCQCGTVKTVTGRLLRSGNTTSCGCFMREQVSARRTKHGETINGWSPEFKAWSSMRARCKGSHPCQKYWAERGIKVCERWQTYENFLADMGRKPSPKHSLDRIDVNGDYTPENCRWATRTEQANNTTKTKWVEFEGQQRPVCEVARVVGLKPATLYARVFKLGWPLDKAISHPVTESKRARVVRRKPA